MLYNKLKRILFFTRHKVLVLSRGTVQMVLPSVFYPHACKSDVEWSRRRPPISCPPGMVVLSPLVSFSDSLMNRSFVLSSYANVRVGRTPTDFSMSWAVPLASSFVRVRSSSVRTRLFCVLRSVRVNFTFSMLCLFAVSSRDAIL